MPRRKKYRTIPTFLTEEEFNQFVLPSLRNGKRGPNKKIGLYKLFCYVMRILSTGMKWQDIEIGLDNNGNPEIHYQLIASF